MAANIFLGTIDSNWGTATNWSLLAVPTASDGNTATFNVLSPDCTVNTSARVCNSIDFTGYTNTITMTQQITVSGNITLDPGMLIAGAASLRADATNTMTSNGKTWPNGFAFVTNAVTFTLADNWTVTGTVTITGNNIIVNGNNLSCETSILMSNGSSGTTTFIMTGTGSWSGAGLLKNNLTFNTAGTITIGSMSYNTGTITYTAGTMNVSGTLTVALSTTFNTSGMTWVAINISGVSTITNNSALTMSGQLTIGGAGTTSINGSDWNVQGGYSANAGRLLAGTAKIVFSGSGTQTLSFGNAATIANNVDFNSLGTIILSGPITAFGYTTGTFTYIAGTISITGGGSFLITGSCTLNTAGITWDNVTVSAVSTITNNSLLTGAGTLTTSSFAVTWAGTSGWTVANYSLTTGDNILKSGLTYTITTSILSVGTLANNGSFTSSIGGSQAILTLTNPTTQDNGFLNGTDIDSSLGATVWTYKGTLSNATNWKTLPTQPPTLSYSS